MKIQVTNKGEARTVDFLAVFAKGETKEFTDVELQHFQAMGGVPLQGSVLSNEDEFDVAFLSEVEDEKKEG